MKQRSVFRIFGLFAIVALLFAATKFKPAPADTGPGDDVASLVRMDTNKGIAVQPVDSLVREDTNKGVSSVYIIKKQKEIKKAVVAAKTTKNDKSGNVRKDTNIGKPLHKGFDSEAVTRTCITDYWDSQVGVREKTNNNDGRAVFSYFRNVGWKQPENLKPKQRYWCGVFMGTSWLNCMESVSFVKSKMQLASVRYWEKGPAVAKADAKPGDVVSLKGYSHVQGVYDRHPNPTFPFYTTVTGNSSASPDDADQRGGVFKRDALWRDVKRVISVEKTLKLTS